VLYDWIIATLSCLAAHSFASQPLDFSFFFQAEDGIRDRNVTGVQTCALPILDWIDNFVSKKITAIPANTDDYELKIFDDAGEMFEEIERKDETHTLSRIVATFDYEHKKDGTDYYVEEIGFKGLWNSTNDKRT